MWFASKALELRALVASLTAALVVGAAAAQARPGRWDPSVVHEFSLGLARISSRTSEVSLPKNPEVIWRVRVASAVPFAPTPAGDGSIVLALATPVLAQYDARGRLSWTARLGASSAAASPIVLADGTRVVLTQSGEAIAFSARGQALRRVVLPLPALETPPLLAAAPDGGVFIAAGRRVLRLDASLAVVTSVRAEQEVTAVLPARERSLITTANGSVLGLEANGSLRRVASFNARLDSAVLGSGERVLGLLDGRRIAELDVATQQSALRFSEPDVEFLSLLVRNRKGDFRLLSKLDFVFAFDAGALEVFRVALPAAGAGVRSPLHELALDDNGTTLLARSGAELIAVHGDGTLQRVEGTACSEPLPPVGVGPGYAVFACRSGILVGVADRAVTDKAK